MLEIESQEDLAEAKARHRNLVLRNWLNGIFMLLAAVAMAGIVIFRHEPSRLNMALVLGLIAVIVKMAEVIFRMPGVLRRPKGLQKSQQNISEDYD